MVEFKENLNSIFLQAFEKTTATNTFPGNTFPFSLTIFLHCHPNEMAD